MQSVIILGAGTMAQEVSDIIRSFGGYHIIGYCVNVTPTIKVLEDRPVYRIEEIEQFLKRGVKFIRGIFSPSCFDFITDIEYMNFEFISIIHPSASVSKTTEIMPGVVINRLVAIGSHSIIKSHALINRGATIGHHNVIGKCVTVGPGANIAGNVFIGTKSLIGMGANVVENSVIEANSFIKAGSLYKRN